MPDEIKQTLDELTVCYTMFSSFQNLLDAEGGYFPSLGTKGRGKKEQERTLLANMYDAEQEKRGDKRRAFRW